VQLSKVLFHPLTAVFLTVLALGLSISFLWSAQQLKKSDLIMEQALEETQKARQEFDAVASQAALAQDPVSKERIIRDQLLMQKPGEVVVQLPDLEVPSPEPSPSAVPITPWEEWKKLLF
jgi:hypothetical protein